MYVKCMLYVYYRIIEIKLTLVKFTSIILILTQHIEDF